VKVQNGEPGSRLLGDPLPEKGVREESILATVGGKNRLFQHTRDISLTEVGRFVCLGGHCRNCYDQPNAVSNLRI